MKSPQIFKNSRDLWASRITLVKIPGIIQNSGQMRNAKKWRKFSFLCRSLGFRVIPKIPISVILRFSRFRDPGCFSDFSGYFRGIKIPILNPGYRDFSDLDPRNSDISRSRFRLSGLRNLQPCPDLDMIFYYSQKTAPEAQQGA